MKHIESRYWLLAGLAIATSIFLTLGTYVHSLNRVVYLSGNDVSTNWFPSVQAIDRIRAALSQLRRIEAHVVMGDPKCNATSCRGRMTRGQQDLLIAEAAYAPLVTPREESILFESYKRQRIVYLEIQDQIISAGEARSPETVKRFLGESEEAYDNAVGTLTRLAQFNGNEGAAVHQVATEEYAKAQIWMVVLNVFFLCAAALLAFRLTRGASRRAG